MIFEINIIDVYFTGKFNLERSGYEERLKRLDSAYQQLEKKNIGQLLSSYHFICH